MQTILLKRHHILMAWVLMVFFAPSAQAQAPAYEWATACGSGPAPYAWGPTKLVVDGRGNTYVAGTFNDTTLIGNTLLVAAPSTAGDYVGDAFVAKLDPQGRVLWATRAGGDKLDLIQGLALDAAGDAYVTGSFDSYSLGFGPAGAGGPVLYNSSRYNEAFVAKLDGTTGQWRWVRRAGGVGGEEGRGIAVSAAGEVYLAGNFSSFLGSVTDFGPFSLTSAGNSDIFIAKLSGSGAWQWVRQTGGTGAEEVSNLLMDSAGAVYVTGSFGSRVSAYTATFGATTLRATFVTGSSQSSAYDLFVGKLDVMGTWIWAVQGDAVNGQNLAGITGFSADGAGHLYVTGVYVNQSVRLGSFVLPNVSGAVPPSVPAPPVPCTNCYFRDAFVARLDAASGAWQWAARAGDTQDDVIGAVCSDGQGRVYVGTTAYAGFADPLLAGGGYVYSAQLDGATGNWRWAAAAQARVLATDAGGRLYMGNYFAGPAASFGATTLPAAGARLNTGYVARLAAGPLRTVAPAGQVPGLVAWPNPIAGHELWVQGARAGQAVWLLDALGRQVSGGIMPITGPLRLALPAGLPAGLFVVRSPTQSQKVVVE